jgi:hypothetical protein
MNITFYEYKLNNIEPKNIKYNINCISKLNHLFYNKYIKYKYKYFYYK